MRETDNYVFFWYGYLSQWHPSQFVVEGTLYNCAEQYMMHQKALFFEDYETALKILKTDHPKEQKALGRQIKNFNPIEWAAYCEPIVFVGNLCKFSQNPDLKKQLLSTGDKLLVEASPYDKIWGVGLEENNELIDDAKNWKGQNLLGKVLTNVRSALLLHAEIR